ncbi:MAG: hypothetical protein PHX70_13375 [Clostridium sp.]|nr:hypothetical protein [Clostridium sp.]
MKKKILAWILVVVVVLGCGYAIYMKSASSKDVSSNKNDASSKNKKGSEKTNGNTADNVTGNTTEQGESQQNTSNEAASKQATKQTQNQTAQQNNVPKSQEQIYMGNWTIKREVAYGTAGTYSKDDINKLIGRNLIFSSKEATCFGDNASDLNESIQNPRYEKSSVPKSQFEAENKMTFDKLGISGPTITMVQAKDSSGKGCTFYIKDDDTMILYGGGVYFEIDRK